MKIPKVAVHVEIDGQWIPVCHQKPLADVKLTVVYQQGALCDHNKKTIDKFRNTLY